MKFFSKAWEKVKGVFRFIGDTLAVALKAFGTYIEQNGGEVLIQAALAAVQAAEDRGGSGSDKFNYAVGAAKDVLKVKGLPVVEHAVQSAVLAAVSTLKLKAGE